MTASAVVNERRAREYETIYILRANVDNAEATKVLDRVRDIVSSLGGCLVQVDNWGRRKLAYPINKSQRGVFVYLRFAGFEDLVLEIERNLRLLDSVIRFQTIQLKPEVDMASYQVDPEELEFAALDETAEEEETSLAQRLGLVERPRQSEDHSQRGGGNSSDSDDDSDDDDDEVEEDDDDKEEN